MTGQYLKEKIRKAGGNVKKTAELMGIPRVNLSQALSAQDVKTGLVEKIAKVLNLPISYFFEEDSTMSSQSTTGNHSPAIGKINNIGSSSEILEQAMSTIADQQHTINTQTNLIAKLIEKTS